MLPIIYDILKTHKLLSNNFQDLSFLPIVSSIATYNYNLAKFLSEVLDPVIQMNTVLKTHSFLLRNTSGKC